MNAPIACNLTADAYRRRSGDLRDLARRTLRAAEAVPDGRRLTFADSGDTRRRLEELVAAEAACCPFLTLDLRAVEGGLRLDITGPLEAQPVIAEMFGRP